MSIASVCILSWLSRPDPRNLIHTSWNLDLPFDPSHNAKERYVTSLYTGVFVLFFSTTPTALHWRSVNPPRFFVFYHVCLTDFEEKLEGLWTGYCVMRQN